MPKDVTERYKLVKQLACVQCKLSTMSEASTSIDGFSISASARKVSGQYILVAVKNELKVYRATVFLTWN